MLVLTRRIGETLLIGEEIRVVVLGIKGAQVRVGIEAPADVRVLRSELIDGKKGEEVVSDSEVGE